MAAISKVIREYTSDDSFTKLDIPIDVPVSEFQVCLAFARDNDGENPTKGKFIPYWDTEKVTPMVIEEFKAKNKGVKVLVSIGNNNKEFPFKPVGGVDEWVLNATKSLNDIIENYHLDGIDVHYMSIQSTPYIFVQCFENLIKNLKGTSVSLATNAATDDNFYLPLYQTVSDTGCIINTVVIQSFVDFKPDPTNKVASLMDKVEAIAKKYENVQNILLGYSTIPDDWVNVSPPVFFVALVLLLGKLNKLKGASIKVIRDTKSSFPPNWIPEMLSLAANNNKT